MVDAVAAAALQFRRHPDGRQSRHPLWEDRLNETDQRSNLEEGFILDHGKEALATSALDAEPQRILHMPGDTLIPFMLALGMLVLFQRSPHPQRSDSLHRRDRLCTGPGRLVLAAGESAGAEAGAWLS